MKNQKKLHSVLFAGLCAVASRAAAQPAAPGGNTAGPNPAPNPSATDQNPTPAAPSPAAPGVTYPGVPVMPAVPAVPTTPVAPDPNPAPTQPVPNPPAAAAKTFAAPKTGTPTKPVVTLSQLKTVREAINSPTPAQAGASVGVRTQNLHVGRKNGQVILTGTVGTQEEKDSAAARASAALGGQQVVNQLTVK
jgi:hypothetical protein